MQYEPPVEVAATKYGKEMEVVARKSFVEHFNLHHEKVTVAETGLHVSSNLPHLGATPDELVSCACHGQGVLEIKCPFKYRHCLKGWESDSSFPISPDGAIRKSHQYYFQMQLQMLVTGLPLAYLYIWTMDPVNSNFILLKIDKDEDLCSKMFEKI
eukprot:gene4034-20209_t